MQMSWTAVEEQGKDNQHIKRSNTSGRETISYLCNEVVSAKVEKEVDLRLKMAGKVYQMLRRKVFWS